MVSERRSDAHGINALDHIKGDRRLRFIGLQVADQMEASAVVAERLQLWQRLLHTILPEQAVPSRERRLEARQRHRLGDSNDLDSGRIALDPRRYRRHLLRGYGRGLARHATRCL